MRYRLAATAFALTACSIVQPVSRDCTLILKPQLTNGSHSQALVDPYAIASIHHVKLDLMTLNGETVTSLGLQRTLLQAQLSNPIVFSNLKPNTTYRISAKAYADAGETQLISTDDSRCYVNVTLTDNDRPTIATIPIQLIDKSFNGQATSSLAINPGGYSPIGSESLKYQGVQGVVTTFAGNGATGSTDGLGTSAIVQTPNGIAIDSQGYFYVTEYTYPRIRKISPAGDVTTLAGNGSKGFVNANGTSATFQTISGVAINSQGYVFATDSGNHVIRKITPTGDVSTFVGSGGTSYSEGTGTNASFRDPTGICIDSQNNLYVTDYYSNRICKITPAGVMTTFVGNGTAGGQDGTGTAATINGPRCVTMDSQGNIYSTDQGGHRIRKITPQGVVTTIYGNGISSQATLNGPAGIAVDNRGYIYFADRYNNRIREIAVNGIVTTIAGNGSSTPFSDGTGLNATFNQPIGMTMDAQGNLFVADFDDNRIRKVQ